MKFLRACIIAFSMYSNIPMPHVRWEKEDMEYSFCFFPIIGIITGAVYVLWWKLAKLADFGPVFAAAVCTAIPVIITGGIHIDGFCDTTDALASHQERERKLEILKDSNVGAFAVIRVVLYFLLYFSVWYQAFSDSISPMVPAMIFVISRGFSGLAAVTWKNARGSGVLFQFVDSAAGRIVAVVLVLWILAASGVMIYIDAVLGTAAVLTAMAVFSHYYRMSRREFGGITGDLAGWFLVMCEFFSMLAVTIAGRVIAL